MKRKKYGGTSIDSGETLATSGTASVSFRIVVCSIPLNGGADKPEVR
jgi:hypothetical protein